MKPALDAIRKLFSLPGRLSVAAKATVCLVVGLVVVLATIWFCYSVSPRHIPWSAYMSWTRGAVLFALISGFAIVAWFTIRTWLSEESTDRSIRSTWSAGLREMRQHGLPLDGLPIHLILGAGTDDDADRLIQASGDYRLIQQPHARGPFTVSASPNRVCLNAGGVGRLALARAALADEVHCWSSHDNGLVPTETSAAGVEELEQYPDSGNLLETLQRLGLEPTGHPDEIDTAESGWHDQAGWRDTGGGAATRVAAQPVRSEAVITAPATARSIARPITLLNDPLEARTAPLWSLTEAAVADQRLHQLANLIRAGRRPLCPINRILVAVPAAVLLNAAHRVADLKRAIRRDLEILRETLQVNAPVTVLVSGLEEHPGFAELIRRAGPQVVRQQPLGQAVEVGSSTDRDQMESLAINACGQVEDAIYALMRRDATLSNPGNAALYRLLCDVRTGIRNSLRDLLVGAFAAEGTTGHSVAGCYFCAAGAQPNQTGFVEPVLRLQDQSQDELEWFPAALRREARHRRLCRAGWLVAAGLTVGWFWMIGAWLNR